MTWNSKFREGIEYFPILPETDLDLGLGLGLVSKFISQNVSGNQKIFGPQYYLERWQT